MAATASSGATTRDIDLWPMAEVAAAIIATQVVALQAIQPAARALASAIEALAERLRGGGRMAYAGAGSSGVIAQLDALEVPGTFGIAADRVPVILAGGMNCLLTLDGGAEDDGRAAEAAVDRLELGPADGLIALAASGSTPFTVAALRRARMRGAVTVGLSCRSNAPLLHHCDHPILVETPGELVKGSTRMAAGTAQKCVLNVLSTGVALRLGHVYRGLMVNMSPDNAKLRERAVGIVAEAAGTDDAAATRALDAAGWSIKTAIVGCARRLDVVEARAQVRANGGDILGALSGAGRD